MRISLHVARARPHALRHHSARACRHALRPLALVCLLALGACGDDDGKSPMEWVDAGPDASPIFTPDGSPAIPADAAPLADGGVANKGIPLVDWVDDLVDQHSTEMSIPDTVHDKNIIDDENQMTFDKYFKR